jgi:squalene-hopene/tetraprenyl-beta-curcumene cyclase
MLSRSRKSLIGVTLALVVGALTFGLVDRPAAASTSDHLSMLLESRAAVHRGLSYLSSAQKKDGSWQDQPAITALVVMGMIQSGEEGFGPKSPVVTKALNYIRSFAKPNGGIYGKYYATYSTSICVTALAQAHLPQDTDLINRAWAYLLDLQADESEGFGPQDTQYGGWGYERNAPEEASHEGEMHRPDLSNTGFALEALHDLQQLCEQQKAAGSPAVGASQDLQQRTGLAYQHAIIFLQRCQNLKTTNDQPWASNDGGFVYRPGKSQAGKTAAGGLRSYASMTYAGLKSMVYAKLTRDDPRVQAAWHWASMHWSVKQNPGLGQRGLFYYYLTMARALKTYGAEQVVDAKGVSHDWRTELVGQLLSVQAGNGSWANKNSRWMESIPDLVTAYSVLAIEQADKGW